MNFDAAKPFTPVNLSAPSKIANLNVNGMVPEAFAYLSPEMLLEFCATKLRGIDEQIKLAFAGQTKRNAVSSALSELATFVSTHKVIHGEAEAKGIVDAYNKAIDTVGPETELGKQLATERDTLFASAGDGDNNKGDNSVDTKEFGEAAQNISRMQGDVNREGELELLQLQSLVSQRQQAVTSISNMTSSLNQGAMTAAQNIGK